MNASPPVLRIRRRIRRLSVVLTLGAALLLAGGAALAPVRLWANVLLGAFLVAGLGLGGGLFLALHYLTGARWSTSLRDPAETLCRLLPPAAVIAAIVAVAGLRFYPWTHPTAHTDPAMWFKNLWLAPMPFIIRAAICAGLWIVLGGWLAAASRRDRSGAAMGNVRLGAVYVLAFAATLFVAGNDWIMSLEPHWYSTIFTTYQFAGIFQSALAALVLIVLWRDRTGASRQPASIGQLHDLGKLLFGFSTFWMYIWISQYMLIWYANIPEETVYFARRMSGLWFPLMLLNIGLNWLVPFVVLLSRPAKKNASVLAKVAVVVLLGRWLDPYLMILPSLVGDVPSLGLCEVGVLAALGLFWARLSAATLPCCREC